MYATTIQDIEIPFLHDAALACELKGFKFRSLYMDPTGECAISYYGHLTEQQIKEVIINFCYPGEDKSYDEVHPEYLKDYTYENGHHSNGEKEYTIIYTPDDLDYRTLKI